MSFPYSSIWAQYRQSHEWTGRIHTCYTLEKQGNNWSKYFMKNYSDDLKFLALAAGRVFLALNFKLVEFVKYLFF